MARPVCNDFRAVLGDFKCCVSCHGSDEDAMDRSLLIDGEWHDGWWCCGASNALEAHEGFPDKDTAARAIIQKMSIPNP